MLDYAQFIVMSDVIKLGLKFIEAYSTWLGSGLKKRLGVAADLSSVIFHQDDPAHTA